MTLGELLAGLPVAELTPAGAGERTISSLDYDSRRVEPGGVFFALAGARTDGNRFVPQALERGAIAVVSEMARPADLPSAPIWIRVPAARRALALAAANFYGRPAETLSLVGVTGTNGKTTTTFLIDSILRAAGRRTGLFGTVLYRTPSRAAIASTTTPESLELTRLLAELHDAGGSDAVLEVSSHALALDRVWGLRFSAAVFTNLTRDHLDFHGTLEDYFAAKRRLFEGVGAGPPDAGVINLDDPHGPALAGLARRTLTYGLSPVADVTTADFQLRPDGLAFAARTPAGPIDLRSPLVGRVNVSNILAATATAVALGVDREAIARGVGRMLTVPGRFERIDEGQPFLVAVDYAHTDDALRRLLETARELQFPGRILLLFGAGGDRDRAKRPLMGEAAGRGADLAVVTSDNPRSEDPLAIINEVVPGLERAGGRYLLEPDRARAVQRILAEARPGDVVLLAGKGHETCQVLKDLTVPFDDRLVAREALRALGHRRSRPAPGDESAG
ncbi:MAG TPA: UDP-N-acetylmuramoyl-L-alanyl-D-glutamate--2,6-diaminopimelate ligase [Candidatus Acidoferrales bacterium]|nr:UDP-N-acetylmuramoyl-L-alanyl-D-glutamate--2,6-diaminopimelate ligase [Candidatus Acidoferrales bacterium]